MFEFLFENEFVEKILVFLFVNRRCHGAQLHRIFGVPSALLQKVLIRLEKGGLICSHYEEKICIYRFNRKFPLLPEFEQLLKKAYTLIPPHKKKLYHAENEYCGFYWDNPEKSRNTLLEFWKKLPFVKGLTFSAHSKSKEDSGWSGRGMGEVIVTKKGSHVLVFNEKGFWKGKENQNISFTNIFRWTLDRIKGVISLEHLRRGFNHPVFLFHLAPSAPHSLSCIDSHLCNGDSYFGQMHFDRYSLKLIWRVMGSKKNEKIEYCYSLDNSG